MTPIDVIMGCPFKRLRGEHLCDYTIELLHGVHLSDCRAPSEVITGRPFDCKSAHSSNYMVPMEVITGGTF